MNACMNACTQRPSTSLAPQRPRRATTTIAPRSYWPRLGTLTLTSTQGGVLGALRNRPALLNLTALSLSVAKASSWGTDELANEVQRVAELSALTSLRLELAGQRLRAADLSPLGGLVRL